LGNFQTLCTRFVTKQKRTKKFALQYTTAQTAELIKSKAVLEKELMRVYYRRLLEVMGAPN